MKLLTFLKRQGLAVAILVASVFFVKWIVDDYRAAGSMTVIEAQAMDMKAMKAPIGVFPVGADYALERNVGGTEKFPATILALSDEDIVARVPGLVKDVHVYPGDRVKAGQLLATLEAIEIDAKALADRLAADSKINQTENARNQLDRERSALRQAELNVKAQKAAVEVARAELEAAENHVSHYQGEVREIEAKKKEVRAELDYAEADYQREQQLFKGGAISKDELDLAKKRIETAKAKVDQVDAQRTQMDHELKARISKRDAARNMLVQSEAKLEGASEAVVTAKAMVASSQSMLAAKRNEASAANAMADSTSALSAYTELRASDDGVVIERVVSPGTPVMPGQAVLRVKVDREVRIQADLPQRLANSVVVGSGVRITSEGSHFDATVTSVFPYVEGRTRTFRVEAIVKNDSHWQVGSYVEMEVFTSSSQRTLSVANKAVKTASDGSHYVWLIVGKDAPDDPNAIYTCTMHPEIEHKGPGICPKCKMDLAPKDARGSVSVEKRKVKIGPRDSVYTSILDGLAEGDQVTVAGDEEMFPGAAIQVVDWGVDGPQELPSGMGVVEGHGEHATEDSAVTKKTQDTHKEDESTVKSSLKGHEDHQHGSDDLYYCPMDHDVHKSEPGSCPICKMDLLPIPGTEE